jgi:hypothetical protein
MILGPALTGLTLRFRKLYPGLQYLDVRFFNIPVGYKEKGKPMKRDKEQIDADCSDVSAYGNRRRGEELCEGKSPEVAKIY